jgi:hypothetical protein
MPRSYTPPADRIARWQPKLNASDEWTLGDYVIGRGSELSALLWCFANAEKWQSREYYFWEIAYHLWEKDRDEPMLVKHKWSFRMIRHACQERYLSVGGAGSSGKSFTMAAWSLVCWLARPAETMVLVTSTDLQGARGRIWGAITKLFGAIDELAPGKLTDSRGVIRYVDEEGKQSNLAGIMLVTSDKSPSKDKVGKLIGKKAKYVMLIADELTDIGPNIQSAATGNLSKNPNFQMIGMANPSSRFDPFGVFSEPRNGWDSVNVEIDMEWRTRINGLFIRFDSEDSPNIVPDSSIEYADGPFPYLATQEQIDEALDILGVNREAARKSREFMRFNRAVFFDSDGSETFYTEADLIKAGALASKDGVVPDFSNATRAAGCDLSFSSGGDKTVMTIADVGIDQWGQYSMRVVGQEYIYQDATDKINPPTLQVAQQIIALCKKYKVDIRNLGIDSSGPGKGTCDMLQLEAGTNDFLRVEFGGGASERKVRNDRNVTAKERYYNRASELFFTAKQYLYGRQIYGIPLLVSKQLCQRGYETKRGLKGLVLQVEPKTKYKLRVGGSPDEADSFLVLVELLRTRFSFLPQDPVPQRAEGQTSSSWKHREKRMFSHLDPSNLGHHANLLPA